MYNTLINTAYQKSNHPGKLQIPPGTLIYDVIRIQEEYTRFVCDHRPLKLEQWRVRLVIGGDKLSCPYDKGSPASDLLRVKILLNSVISDSDKDI